MVYFYALMVVLGIVDIKELKNTGQKKDFYVYGGSMILVAVFGYYYLSDPYRASLANLLLSLLNLKG